MLERLLQVNLSEGKEKDENLYIDIETDWKRIKQSETQPTTQIIIKKKTGNRPCMYNVTLRCVHAITVAEGKK